MEGFTAYCPTPGMAAFVNAVICAARLFFSCPMKLFALSFP
jgi:hypothetical protein